LLLGMAVVQHTHTRGQGCESISMRRSSHYVAESSLISVGRVPSDRTSTHRCRRRTVPSSGRLLRNARLLLQSGIQHLVDDPALLVVQLSRRLPFSTRVRAGTAVRAITSRIPGGGGAGGLGAIIAGEVDGGEGHVAWQGGCR